MNKLNKNNSNSRGWTIRKCDIIKDGHSWLENNDLRRLYKITLINR